MGLTAAAAFAQPAAPATPAPTPTAQTVPEDPWARWVREYYKVIKVKKGEEMRVDDTHAYPDPRIKALMEIVREDENFVYLRNLPLEDPRSAGYATWLAHEGREAQLLRENEQSKDLYILPDEKLAVPPPFVDAVVFHEHSEGLPKSGLWQMGFDLADFDHNGLLDLVLPPARKGAPFPWIVLQGKDGWQIWKQAVWPQDISFDYGDVKVADFDGDGNLDIAIANHFKESYILYGDGKGGFTRVAKLPRGNDRITSRAIAVADFNRDGRPDVVQLAELDLDLATNRVQGQGLISIDLNTPNGWTLSPARFPAGIYGDNIVVGDFNGDGAPDILTSSNKAENDAFIFINDGTGQTFTPVRSNAFPSQPYVTAVAAGSLDGRKPEQAILALTQTVRPRRGESYTVHAIFAYRVADAAGRMLATPERRLLYRDQAGDTRHFLCLAVGDLDGDGRPDIVAGRNGGGLLVLMQMPDGQFVEQVPRLDTGDAVPNHIAIQDIDGDGKAELIVNFSDGAKTPGSVRVWKVSRAGAVAAKARAAGT
jgi:hypothetical protein